MSKQLQLIFPKLCIDYAIDLGNKKGKVHDIAFKKKLYFHSNIFII
jgi:hypothetical protein